MMGSTQFTLMTLCLFCLASGRLSDDSKRDHWKRGSYGDDENASESPLSKFFREPQLGTSWYNPGGPTPTFQVSASRQSGLYEGATTFSIMTLSMKGILNNDIHHNDTQH
jgi:hypothetical protein